MDSIAKIPHIDKQAPCAPTVWYGCYDGGWKDISPESFSHPAKFAQGLVRKIYEYGLEMGYIKVGDVILDTFGGVGLGAKYALANGLSWIGCELEARFTDLGQGCECTGISKADWIRYYGRWDKMAHKGGHHWCPQCLAQAKQVTDSRQLSFFEPDPTAAYVRNSGIIPETQTHYYRGNLDLFKKYAKPGTWAVLLNGDSRNLRAVIGQAQVDGLLSSPPFVDSDMRKGGSDLAVRKAIQTGRNPNGASVQSQSTTDPYGQTAGQLGAMKPGSLADSLLSSPPYINSLERPNGVDADKIKRPGGRNSQSVTDPRYGESDGQLGAMKEGSLGGLVSSPPFTSSIGSDDPDKRGGLFRDPKRRNDRNLTGSYGESEGQLGSMAQGDLDGLISSPPFSPDQPCASQTRAKKDYHAFTRGDGTKRDHVMRSKENLDGLPMTGLDAALQADSLVSSPPFAGNTGGRGEASRNGIDAALFDRHSGGMKRGTGDDPGNLDHLPMRGLQDALLSSPPFESSLESKDTKFNGQARPGRTIQCADYGQTTGQLGIEQGQTFWAAARQIVTESYLALKPGAVTFWVCKSFIRDGKMIDFPNQWKQLCESVGLEYIESIHAMLVSQEQKQENLDGGSKTIRKERKSFFRRLAERNGSPRIDYEVVLILRKPCAYSNHYPNQESLEAAR